MSSFPGGTISGNIIPSAAGQDLGTSGAEWDVVAQNGSFTGTLDVSGTLSCVDISASSNYATNGTLSAVGGLTVSSGASSVRALSCTTLAASSNVTVGGALTSTGAITASAGLVGAVTGNVTGNINGTVGAVTPAAGTFTTLISTGGAINGTVGASTPAAGTFTTTSAATATATTAQVVSATNGATWTRGYNTELITLSTSGTTTDSVANLLPADSIIEAVVARVTTTITTATDWKLGDATIAGRFSAVNAVMTSGSTQVGTVHVDQTGTSGPRQTAAAKLRITTTGTPGAGVIRVTVFYRQFVAPTS